VRNLFWTSTARGQWGPDVQHSPSCPVLAIPAEGELKVNAPAVLTLLAAAAVNL
jgi:hypothetical protein